MMLTSNLIAMASNLLAMASNLMLTLYKHTVLNTAMNFLLLSLADCGLMLSFC